MSEKRRKAIRRRRIFFACCFAVLAVLIAGIVFAVNAIVKAVRSDAKPDSAVASSVTESVPSGDTKPAESKPAEPEYVTRGNFTLDANYSRLLLVNGWHPLPEGYAYGENLTKIEAKYHNGQLDEIDQDVWPYMQAMIEAAWKDGVQLYVWSPYRSYDTQNMLFRKQVQRCLDRGVAADQAETEAATVVAMPGTSEHNTGLCADFNMASDAFETTPMFAWMQQHAAEYGFILRYPKEAQNETGVIYESWHWRFVGINTAAEINRMGVTLEKYIEQKGLDPQAELKNTGTPEMIVDNNSGNIQ